MEKLIVYYKDLIVRNKAWLYITLGIFLFGAVGGLVISQTNPEVTKQILSDYASSIDPNLQSEIDTAFYILERNITIVLFSNFGGIFFGLLPIFVGLTNGLILGVIVGFPQIYEVLNPVQFLLLLLPHGVIEYIGSLLGLAFGIKLGLNWLRKSAKGQRIKTLVKDFKESFAISILSLLLLIIAAFIEGYLTADIACILAKAC